MIPPEETYQQLLAPCKDPAKSFEIDLAELLCDYVRNFIGGKVPVNFNSAALLLQGSAHLYGKKVEYLHNLATQLYHHLSKKKKEDPSKKEPNIKIKEKKEGKFSDPFFPTDLKVGKNLSVLKRKNAANKNTNTAKKPQKKTKKYTTVPVNLLPFEGEEKGEVFYDVIGEAVGNKGDYTLNKCKVSKNGWILLPTINLNQIPPETAYSMDLTMNASMNVVTENHSEAVDQDMPQSSPDEGFDPGSEAGSQPCDTPEITLSQQTDEGLGSISSTPAENPSQASTQSAQSQEPMEGVESTPVNGLPESDDIPDLPLDDITENLNMANKSVRRSMRHAEKPLQEETKDSTDDTEKNETVEEEMPVVRRAIQKRNTCNLPAKLKTIVTDNGVLSIDEYCARTFFSPDNKVLKNGLLPLETRILRNNANFLMKLQERYEALKAATRKNKKDEDDSLEIDIETLIDPEPDDAVVPAPLEDEDIVINNNLEDMAIPESAPPSRDISQTEPPPEDNAIMDDIQPESLNEPDAQDKRSHQELERNAEIAAKVRQWQDQLLPYLEKVGKREEFDINQYGGHILNSFDPPSAGKQRKQTTTFKKFCTGMQKWQIHRYFMALLPLANIGNVKLESEKKSDGEEEILITLISKKMHHLRLEEFDSDVNRKSSKSAKK